MALGYRRSQRGGTWLARIRDPFQALYGEKKLGRADDEGCPADGAATLSFDQALKEARKAQALADAKRVSGVVPGAGKLTINDILGDYEKAYRSGEARRGGRPGRDITNLRSMLELHIRPALGYIQLNHLNAELLKKFKADLASGQKLTRNGLPPKSEPYAEEDPEAESERLRRRRARANRIITPLRAALNYALSNNCLASDAAWRTALKAYADVDRPTVRYLSLEECKNLQKAAEPDFADLIKAARLTGCRYGSLRFIKVGDVDLKARTAIIRVTKNGKPQIIRLTQKGCVFLQSIMKKKKSRDFLFTKSSGDPWKPSEQLRRMKQACEAAEITPAIGFHGLRDTFASHLVMGGVPILTVSRLLGHADTRITEKYYVHLAPDYLHDVLDKHLPDFF